VATIRVREFTDPACPWAFSAEPGRLRLRWLYGEEIQWRPHMVVLSERADEADAKGFTPDRLAAALTKMQRRFGMPIATFERTRNAASLPACRAVVAARLHDPDREPALLRRLRVHAMAGALLDEPETIAVAARDAGLDPVELEAWCAEPDTEAALRADMAMARAPSEAALALNHKLADAGDGRRYTCPSYEIERLGSGSRLDLPGFQPVEAYEAAIANLVPELPRRDSPVDVEEVLRWAGEPLATVEVAAVCGMSPVEAREALARVGDEQPVGADGYWSLRRSAAAPVRGLGSAEPLAAAPSAL
jgi:predicted DsbA family dithiol-disulfide isomerase